MSIYLYLLLIVNAIGFWIMLYDKNMAKIKGRRVPEKSLFCIAAVGGSFGCMLGMYIAHHKTRHLSFQIGMPAIFVAQVILIIFFFR